ncbi:MAG: aldose 1-epimerase family protein [Sciscionella sp.]
MQSPTGEQFDIRHGAARAIITEVGATLRLFESAGVPYTETFGEQDKPPSGCGNILIPWPNRTGGARWTFEGETQHLEHTEPQRGNAIHGLVRHVPWTVLEREEAAIELGVEIGVQPGWPVPLDTTIRYEVSEDGLRVTHTVRNIGERAVSFGVGAHPYVKAGPVSNSDCDLRLAARMHLQLDQDRMLPLGAPEPVRGTRYDLHSRRRLFCEIVSEGDLDDCFTDCAAGTDRRFHHRLTHPRGGVELWTDRDFRWVQVFTPDHFAGKPSAAIAIEPMTCPPDALNSGVDLLTVAPGERWSGSWGIRPLSVGRSSTGA